MSPEEHIERHVKADQRRYVLLVATLVVVLIIVLVSSTGVVVLAVHARSAAKRATGAARRATIAARVASKNTRGLVTASCVLVSVIEQGADSNTKIIAQLPKGSSTIKPRQQSEDSLNHLAAKMRRTVTCPPRRPALLPRDPSN